MEIKLGSITIHITDTKHWIEPFYSVPKKIESVLLGGKSMTSAFWESSGIVLIDDLAEGQTLFETYCVRLLDKLNEIIKDAIVTGLLRIQVLYHNDHIELRHEFVTHQP